MVVSGSTLTKLLRHAQENGYAIPHFNYSDLWDLLAIIEAAEEEQAPIIFASIPKVVNSFGADVCGAVGVALMARARVPVVHHLDHAVSFELCKAAIDCGYPSILMDASMHPLAENTRIVKQVVEYAHAKGVHVEAEIGRIPASKDEGTAGTGKALVDPDEARRLVDDCGVDSLAIGIGTAHGFYKEKPHIDFDRLARVKALVSVPLVLHGGTGVPEDDVRRAIRGGIAKVNVGTIIRHTYLTSLRDALGSMELAAQTADIQTAIRPRIKQVVREWIQVCMASGKASAAL
jgi:ketose-bisphosphate aldolase